MKGHPQRRLRVLVVTALAALLARAGATCRRSAIYGPEAPYLYSSDGRRRPGAPVRLPPRRISQLEQRYCEKGFLPGPCRSRGSRAAISCNRATTSRPPLLLLADNFGRDVFSRPL